MAASEISEQTVPTSQPTRQDPVRKSEQDADHGESEMHSEAEEATDYADDAVKSGAAGEIFDDVHVQNLPQNGAEGDGEEEDAAIAEYLQDLLRRVNGRVPAQTYGKTATPPRVAAEPEIVSEKQDEPVADVPDEQPEPPAADQPPGEYLPSYRAPEKATQLRDMRDLANSTARQAIAVSKTRTLRKLYSALSLSVLCMVVAAALLVFTPDASSNTYRSGVGVLCVAVTLSLWFFHLLRVHNGAQSPRSRRSQPTQTD